MDHNGWVRAIHDLLAAVRGSAADRLRRLHPTAVVGAAGLVVCLLFVAAFGALDDDGRDLSPTAGAARGAPEAAVGGEAPATTGLVAGADDPVTDGAVAGDRAAGPPAPAVTAATAGGGGVDATPDAGPVTTGPTATDPAPPPATGTEPPAGTTTSTTPAPTEPPPGTTTTAPPAPDLLAPLRPLLGLLGLG